MSDRQVAALVRGLRVSAAGRIILGDISLVLARGQITCLIGDSGSGKTTLGALLAGLLPVGMDVEQGQVTIGDSVLQASDCAAFAALRGRRVGMILQDPGASLNPLRRCGPQVADPLRIHNLAGGALARQRALHQLASTGLEDAERIYASFPRQISGGQRQRVLMAQATILQPNILVADEPTASLDQDSRDFVLEYLRAIARERGTAVLLITHDMELARETADVVLRLCDGSISEVARDDLCRQQERENAHADPAGHALVEVRRLEKSFAGSGRAAAGNGVRRVLDGVDLVVAAGEMMAVVGPSGSGKTTLGRCIAGLETPDMGTVSVAGRVVLPRGLRPHDGRIQVIYQQPGASLNPRCRVGPILGEALAQREQSGALSAEACEQDIGELLQAVGLQPDIARRYPAQLSGGEQQRVAIARTLARGARLIIADEPTASLNETNKRGVLRLLREFASGGDRAVILITHERELARAYCDRLFVMERGRLAPASAGPATGDEMLKP